MSKPIAIFDLDDTLINLKEELYRSLHERYGKDKVPHWSLWEYFNIEKLIGISEADLIKTSIDDETFRKIQPHLFSQYLLKDLHERGFHIIILTARDGFVPNAYRETAEYLTKHDLYYDELIVSKVGGNKVDYLGHYDTINFVVDDSTKNCRQFAESGKFEHVFLHALPHNKSCNEFIRLHNLYQLYPHIGLV